MPKTQDVAVTRRALVVLSALLSMVGVIVLPAQPAGAADQSVFAYGDAPFHGSTGTVPLNHAVVGMARTPTGDGYWLAARDGRVHPFGAAPALGSVAIPNPAGDPVVGIAATPTGRGYWLATSTGAVYSFGDAGFHGSLGAVRLKEPIVGIASTRNGAGYWMVARDGGVFTFGNARFMGSTGAMRLNQPIAGMAPTPSGNGYWLVARDGGIFTFGDAGFFGSTGAIRLVRSIVGMAASPTGRGYWLVAGDGGIFTFGDARFLGSVGGGGLTEPAVGIVTSRTGKGYWIVTAGHVAQSSNAQPAQAIIHPGTYRVGADGAVPPGVYRATHATPSCRWERTSAFEGAPLIANTVSGLRQVVEIKASDAAFRTIDCAPFVNELFPVRANPTAPLTDGMWVEGLDVAAGMWRTTDAGPGCTWTRVADFSGETAAVKATGSGTEEHVVQIDPSDAGFVTKECGTWRRA